MSTSVAIPALERRPVTIDLSRPIFIVLAAILGILVVLPLFWLGYYSLVDQTGRLTFANFAALASDPTLRRPFLVALGMALGVGLLSCVIATPLAWLVARSDLPGRTAVRALVTASFVTPPFLGAIAWEILAAPNSGLVNVGYRALFGLEPYEYLVDIYTF
jgi:iron(III) transport system permease protein